MHSEDLHYISFLNNFAFQPFAAFRKLNLSLFKLIYINHRQITAFYILCAVHIIMHKQAERFEPLVANSDQFANYHPRQIFLTIFFSY